MKTIINNHHNNILGKKPSINTSTCNSRNKKACPLSGYWELRVVYERTLSSNQQNYKEKKYFGIAEECFKGHLQNHKLCFRNESYKNQAKFSGKSR